MYQTRSGAGLGSAGLGATPSKIGSNAGDEGSVSGKETSERRLGAGEGVSQAEFWRKRVPRSTKALRSEVWTDQVVPACDKD